MYRKFKSLESDQLAYAIDTEHWDSKAPIDDAFRVFQVLGDGLTAHSPDWSLRHENFADFLASLVQYLIDLRTNTLSVDFDEIMQHVSRKFTCRPSERDIEFAASVEWKESDKEWGKRRYISIKDRKLTKANKEYDKRYQEVAEWMDGSALAIFRFLIPEYADDLMRFSYASAIREWCHAQEDRPYCQSVVELLKWYKDEPNQRDRAQSLQTAFEACKYLGQSYELHHSAVCALGNYTRNHMKKPERKQPIDCTAAQEAQETAVQQ